MKKHFFLLMLATLVGFASCSQSDNEWPLQTDEVTQATFQVQPPATRASVEGLSHYIVEAYEAKDLTQTPVRVESSTGSLTLTLKKNTEYTFLFWADFAKVASGTTEPLIGYYRTDNLQEVSVVDNTLPGERAYCLAVSFNSKDFEANKTVVLKNAVAQVNLIEATGLTAANNTVTITYPASTKFNVGTGAIVEASATPVAHTFTGIAQIAKDEVIATDYILAPQGSQAVTNISVQLNKEAKKYISNVPFQCNYKTNIKGEYSNLYNAGFGISNEVDDYEHHTDQELTIAKIGDYYYKDNTFSANYDASKGCIGVVYRQKTTTESGMIVSLTEGAKLTWGPKDINSPADDLYNGQANMDAVKAIDPDFSDYPAFSHCAKFSPSGSTGWYLPAKYELQALYAGYNGLRWVAKGVVPGNGEVVEWEDFDNMPDQDDTTARTYFNKKLTDATTEAGTSFARADHWSSSEDTELNSWYVYFAYGATNNHYNKGTRTSVRCVKAF